MDEIQVHEMYQMRDIWNVVEKCCLVTCGTIRVMSDVTNNTYSRWLPVEGFIQFATEEKRRIEQKQGSVFVYA